MLKNRKLCAALAFALSLVMAFTMTAMADGNATVNVSSGTTTDAVLNWPTEACIVTVSGLTAGDKTSVIVYNGAVASLPSLTSGNIFHIDQAVANAEGNATFSFVLKSGDYSGYARYNDGVGNIKVVVGNDGTYQTPQYAYIVLKFKKEVASISVDPDANIFEVGDSLEGDVTVTYTDDNTETFELTNDEVIKVTGWDSTAVHPELLVTASLDLANGVTPVSDSFTVSVVEDKENIHTVTFKDQESGDVLHTAYVDDTYYVSLPGLPSYTEIGDDPTYQCVGWYDNTDKTGLYPAGASVQVNKDMEFYGVWVDLNMLAGCSIRTDAKETLPESLKTSGVRWTTVVDKELYEAIEGLVGSSNVSVGALLCPNSYLKKSDLGDDEAHFDMVSLDKAASLADKTSRYVQIHSRRHLSDELFSTFNIALVNLGSYTRITSGRSFIEVTYPTDNNRTVIYYGPYVSDDHSRSAQRIAGELQTDPKHSTYYSGLGDMERSIIDEYAG